MGSSTTPDYDRWRDVKSPHDVPHIDPTQHSTPHIPQHPKDLELGPDYALRNHETYREMQRALDANIHNLPGGKPIKWFEAAHIVTDWDAVGTVDTLGGQFFYQKKKET